MDPYDSRVLARPDIAAADPGFGVYVHWPFCESKCPYCDFNSHVRERIDEPRWQQALLAEIDHFAALAPARSAGGRLATSLFFGGGTPSLMPAGTVAAVIDRVAERFGLAADAEITLEANPGSAEAARFRGYREAGVNRVSIGVQSLDDQALRFLGRRHGATEALAAVRLARDIFPRLSFDLIYARPGQGEGAWRGELTARARTSKRPSLPLPAHHRGGDAVCRRGAARRARPARR